MTWAGGEGERRAGAGCYAEEGREGRDRVEGGKAEESPKFKISVPRPRVPMPTLGAMRTGYSFQRRRRPYDDGSSAGVQRTSYLLPRFDLAQKQQSIDSSRRYDGLLGVPVRRNHRPRVSRELYTASVGTRDKDEWHSPCTRSRQCLHPTPSVLDRPRPLQSCSHCCPSLSHDDSTTPSSASPRTLAVRRRTISRGAGAVLDSSR